LRNQSLPIESAHGHTAKALGLEDLVVGREADAGVELGVHAAAGAGALGKLVKSIAKARTGRQGEAL
jgi:hypothetical protein